MTRTIWVTWVTFLVGQVGLICKLNYLDITCSLGKQCCHWYLVAKWENFGSDECTEISLHNIIIVWNQLIISRWLAVLKHVISKDFIFKKSVQGTGFCTLPSMKKSIYGIVLIKNFSLLSKRKFQHVGHKWVICGSHLDCSVDQWVKWVNRCDPLSTLLAIPRVVYMKVKNICYLQYIVGIGLFTSLCTHSHWSDSPTDLNGVGNLSFYTLLTKWHSCGLGYICSLLLLNSD